MTQTHGLSAFDTDGPLDRQVRSSPPDYGAVLSAVREDIRQTLRSGWVDPALDGAAAFPAFFAAAWSAIRPNIGKSFLLLARAVRTAAADGVRSSFDSPDLRKLLQGELSEEELRRVEDSARAAHLATAKVQIVVHVLYRAARRERIGGTGREESPIRRGVPDWQRWMSAQPASELTRQSLDEAASLLEIPAPPSALKLLSRWPPALDAVWAELRPAWATNEWRSQATRLRRIVLAGVNTLPHPIELQWAALRQRGLTEEDRLRILDFLAAHDAAMPDQSLSSAFTWIAFGAPEIGAEA